MMYNNFRPNEEKVVYFLLLSRKERQPSVEDEAKVPGVGNQRGRHLLMFRM